jgi:hypothetical protein
VKLPPWWSGFLTGVAITVVGGLLVLAIKSVVASVWRHTLDRPVHLLITNLKMGKHHCGHRSGQYTTDRNGHRTCMKCAAKEVLREAQRDARNVGQEPGHRTD